MRLILIVAAVIILVAVIVSLFSPLYEEISIVRYILICIVAVFAALLGFLLAEMGGNLLLPRSYNVAIVGFPKSGKTTLIVSLFGEAFAGNISPVKMDPVGSKTIERVNAYLEQIRKGRALGPTKDQDRFAFRANLTVRRFPLPRKYKVEFGDFPGKDSEDYSIRDEIQDEGWLHNTEFFKWVIDSDAMVFVVDLGRYLSSAKKRQDYVVRITTSFRAAWQYYLDMNERRKKEVVRHPLVLVFSKADLFGVKERGVSEYMFEREIAKLGFGDKTPPVEEIDHEVLRLGQDQVKDDFSELIRFFNEESGNFHILFCSSFGLFNGKRLGINDLLLTSLSQ